MAQAKVTKALIPAAGRGTRFLPLTKAVPKELAPLVTTPALELVVAEAAGVGVTDVLLVVNPEKSAIRTYFSPHPDLEAALEKKGDTAALDSVTRPEKLARTHYTDQDDPRGLGHAVGCGEQFAAGEPLAVLLPDDLVDDRDALLGPMLDVYAEHGGVVLGAARRAAPGDPQVRLRRPGRGLRPGCRRRRDRRPRREARSGRGARARWRSSAATSCRRRSSTRCARPIPARAARSS